jgi:hypothetical protein
MGTSYVGAIMLSKEDGDFFTVVAVMILLHQMKIH